MFKKPVTWIVLLLITMAGYIFWPQAGLSTKKSMSKKPVKVEIQAAKSILLKDEISALGTAQANESVTITAQSTDRVKHIYFDDGDIVKKGQRILALDHAEEKALVHELEINIGQQKRQLDRLRDLEKSSATAESAIDNQNSLMEATQAKLAVAKVRLAEKFIQAPFSGQLGLRHISEGQLVTNNTEITSLDDLTKIKVEFLLPEKFLNRVEVGQTVLARNVAYKDTFSGQVDSISSRVDKVTRAFKVRALFDNTKRKLRPGMLLQIDVETQSQQALIIPESAIIPINSEHYVYQVIDGTVKRTQIEIGRRKPGIVEVVEGLVVGDQVVTQGVIKVRQGSKVISDTSTKVEG